MGLLKIYKQEDSVFELIILVNLFGGNKKNIMEEIGI